MAFCLLTAAALAVTDAVHVFGLPFTQYRGQWRRQRDEAFANLDLAADLNKERLERWLEECRSNVSAMAGNTMIRAAVARLRRAVSQQTASPGADASAAGSISYEPVSRTLSDRLDEVLADRRVYSRILIADMRTARVIASTREQDVGMDVSREPYWAAPSIGHGTYTSDIEVRPPDGTSRLFFADVIGAADADTLEEIKDGPAAILVAEVINPCDIIRQVLDTNGDAGNGSEILLVNKDVNILALVAHPLPDPTAMRPLEHHASSEAAQLAAAGNEGIIETENDQDRRVLAAYRHIEIAPGIGWGLVVERDLSDLFAPLRTDMTHSLVIGLVGIVAVITLTIVIGRGLTGPIMSLSAAAEKVAKADFAVRAPVVSRDEVGTLAATFNTMVERIDGWRSELKREVGRRTTQLSETNKALEAEIAERKRVEQVSAARNADLVRLNAELFLKNVELNEYTSVASHDLQEPLRRLVSFGELLEKDLADVGLPDDAAKDLAFIRESAGRMQMLVRDLLALSRAGRAEMRHERVSLAKCAEHALDALATRIEETGAEIRLDPLPDVVGDWTLLTQLYQNLISNALKFVGTDAPKIHITVDRTDHGTVLGVRDNGIGLKPEYADAVFAPFRRLHSRSQYEGSGIGLAICRKAVERHGGRIWVESELGQGAHFRFTLNDSEKGSCT